MKISTVWVAMLVLGMFVGTNSADGDDWPQWLGPKRDGVWREDGILTHFPKAGPPVRWRQQVGAGYSGPAVAGGRVYLTDRLLAPKDSDASRAAARGTIAGTERVLCLDQVTGQLLWKHEYDCPYNVSYPAGPRATPVVDQGKVYTLGTEGDLLCLDSQSGKVLWGHQFKTDYQISTPVWGFSAHPLIDGNKLICLAGGNGTTAVAYDKNTGKQLWAALNAKEPGYCPPMIYEAGGKRQLIIWHPEAITSLDPESGEVYWTEPWNVRSGLTVPTPRKEGDRLFFTSFYNGPLMFRLAADKPEASVLWRGKSTSERNTDGLHSIIAPPVFDGDYIYGVCSYGQLRCLNATTGERIWESFKATTSGEPVRWATAFLIKHGDRYFIPTETGDLIIARLTPKGYEEISRTPLLEPTNTAAGRAVVWSHPAFANRSVYARNDKEIICLALDAPVGGN